MLKLIKNAEVYAPQYLGQQSVLLIDNKIAQIGEVNENIVDVGLEVEVIDGTGSIVMPGIIDPHVHLIGGGGEGGFATRTPEIQISDIVRSGITTVVGCLGTDGTTRHMTSLLAKARGLEIEGISTYIYTGNYHVPTPTITSSVKDDIINIDKIIGAGEIALSDSRGAQPSIHEVAKLVAEARIGGLLSGKAGVTHFHIGPGKLRLQILHQIMEDYEIPASKIYCTHITRSKELVDDAIALASKGAFVDMTASSSTSKWLAYYKEQGGDMDQLTFSSDGNGSLPKFDINGKLTGIGVASTYTLYEQFVASVRDFGISLEEAIPVVTSNTATALELKQKGRLEKGHDADILILNKEDLAIKHVFAKGKQMVNDGEVVVKGTFEN
ncbi:beta-aspartyl-peptidase [Anaerobacillus arseniciselenatis]|uniref:Isoaspartyl dipeptidase n=1 Tax=Anaerobacillus arseniciselenatis TaxID=85682 RepID=A0A1S2LTS7_9BACI|nr:beta-aspartyl-peptidase [Anaerobacillus arseniciselenatis]OIJ15610.1 beta-aspartyl-peptidase [Anaerobacillus arseniciselenatis]